MLEKKKLNTYNLILAFLVLILGIPLKFILLVYNLSTIKKPKYSLIISKHERFDPKNRLYMFILRINRDLSSLKIEFIFKKSTLNGISTRKLLVTASDLLQTHDFNRIVEFLKELNTVVHRFNSLEQKTPTYPFVLMYDPVFKQYHYYYLWDKVRLIHPTSWINFNLAPNQRVSPAIWTALSNKVLKNPNDWEPGLVTTFNADPKHVLSLKSACGRIIHASAIEVNASLSIYKGDINVEPKYQEYIAEKKEAFDSIINSFDIPYNKEQEKFVISMCSNSFNLSFTNFDVNYFRNEFENVVEEKSFSIFGKSHAVFHSQNLPLFSVPLTSSSRKDFKVVKLIDFKDGKTSSAIINSLIKPDMLKTNTSIVSSIITGNGLEKETSKIVFLNIIHYLRLITLIKSVVFQCFKNINGLEVFESESESNYFNLLFDGKNCIGEKNLVWYQSQFNTANYYAKIANYVSNLDQDPFFKYYEDSKSLNNVEFVTSSNDPASFELLDFAGKSPHDCALQVIRFYRNSEILRQIDNESLHLPVFKDLTDLI